jgi:hypothetical protein
VQTDAQAVAALTAAGFTGITDLAHHGRMWKATATEANGTVCHVVVHGRNGGIVIEDDVDVPKPDLHADVLSLLDAWDVARVMSNSQVDQLKDVAPHLDRLSAHYDDVDAKVRGPRPKEDAPKADAKPLAPAARPGASPATPPR